MLKKILLGLLALIVLGLLYLNYGHQPKAIDHNTFSASLLRPGPFPASSFDLELTDHNRPTMAHGDYPGADSRTLLTRVWLPGESARKTPRPLLVYSHGFMSSRIGGTHLAEHLASLGYIVAAPDFPLTNFYAPKPQRVRDVVNQPEDISFVIDSLLQRAATEGDELYQAIDETRIAAAGMSLGGMTTTMAAFHPELGDPRIAAAISIAGPAYLFSEKFYAHRQLPFLMIASPMDAMVSFPQNAQPIPERVENSVLVSIDGASHTGFSYQAQTLRWFDNPDEIGCKAVKAQAEQAKEEDPWYDELGSPEQGILRIDTPPLCVMDPLPPAMNPIRQQWFATLAVTAFLQSLFDPDPDERQRYRQFLLEQLPFENPEISVRSSAAFAAAGDSPQAL